MEIGGLGCDFRISISSYFLEENVMQFILKNFLSVDM